MELHFLYRTDAWHTHRSKQLLAVCSSVHNAALLAHAVAQDEDLSLVDDEHQWNLLNTIKQTQGYHGEGEFLIESMELDKLDN